MQTDAVGFDSISGADRLGEDVLSIIADLEFVIQRIQAVRQRCESASVSVGIEELDGNIVILDDVNHGYLFRNSALDLCNSRLSSAAGALREATHFLRKSQT